MLSPTDKQNLLQNWGDKAEALACKAEVRVYDPSSSWECYLIALNPDDENTVKCLIRPHKNAETVYEEWTLENIKSLFNENGESVIVDDEYMPQGAAQLFKNLNARKSWN